jgi:hypothetical protein
LSGLETRHEIGAINGGETLNRGVWRLGFKIVGSRRGHWRDGSAVISTGTSNSDNREKEKH